MIVDHQEYLDFKDQLEQLVSKDHKVTQDWLGHKAYLAAQDLVDLMECQDQRVQQDLLALKDHKATLVRDD